MQLLSRRSLLSSAAVLAAGGLASCASVTNPTTGQVTYGLDPAVVSFIQSTVAKIAGFTPVLESIAATAAGYFGQGYAAIVTAGSAAVNTVISALTNLLTNLPVAAARLGATARRLSAAASGMLVGYTKPDANGKGGGVPVFAQ